MPFLSVVIPVYKTEAYLERCVNSVTKQDFTDVEIILVDDGSPDKCPEICDSLAEKDNRITVIHKQNGGLSSARNAGIEIAKGEYISFLDSDDAWAEGKLKELVCFIKNHQADMYCCSVISICPNGERYREVLKFETGVCDKTDYYRKLGEAGNLREAAWSKVLRTETIRKNALFFQKGLISEDNEWMFRVLRNIHTVAETNVDLCLYTYARNDSITNTVGLKSVKDILTIIKQSVEYYKNHKNSVENYELAHCAYLLSIVIGYYGGLSNKDKNTVKKDIKALIPLFSYNTSKKVKAVKMVYPILGLCGTALLLNQYMKLNRKKVFNKEKINE